jgi:O-antigen ligase
MLVAALSAHAILGLYLMRLGSLATLHALVTLGVGVALGLISRTPAAAVCAAAYAAGSEAVWRLAHAQVFWEFGKYSSAVILLAALYRLPRPRIHGAAALYFLLLLPSAVITYSGLPFEQARQRISFNLSGPLLLAVAILVFSNIRLTVAELHRAFAFYMMPLASVVAIASYGIATASDLRFTNDSNAVTSGGFGPNQVSAALGLAAFFAILCLLDERWSLRMRVVLFGALLIFAIQSAFTFSRSGLYTAAFGAMLSLVYLVRLPPVRARLTQVAPILFMLILIAWPRIDAFTDGALAQRFTDTNLTHRDELAYDDWLTFLENPLFGAGPGMGQAARMGLAAHTEYSRLLAEHGLCGLAALAVLAFAALRRWATAPTNLEKAYIVSMIGWAVLYMAVNGMRLAAPSFVAGLAFTQIASRSGRR